MGTCCIWALHALFSEPASGLSDPGGLWRPLIVELIGAHSEGAYATGLQQTSLCQRLQTLDRGAKLGDRPGLLAA